MNYSASTTNVITFLPSSPFQERRKKDKKRKNNNKTKQKREREKKGKEKEPESPLAIWAELHLIKANSLSARYRPPAESEQRRRTQLEWPAPRCEAISELQQPGTSPGQPSSDIIHFTPSSGLPGEPGKTRGWISSTWLKSHNYLECN